MKKYYSLWQRIFGPRVTETDVTNLEFKAFDEGWGDWLLYEMATAKSERQLKWLLAGLRDGHITVTVLEVAESEAYFDPDPFEQD